MAEFEKRAAKDATGRRRKTSEKVAIGCSIAGGVILLLLIAGIVVFAIKAKGIVGYFAGKWIYAIIDQSSLEPAEKEDAKRTVRLFVKETIDGRIPQEKATAILDNLMTGTLKHMAMLGALRHAVERSGLSPEEKTKAHEAINLFYAGLAQKKISKGEADSVLAVTPKDEAGNLKKPPWEREEIRKILAGIERVTEGKEIVPGEGQLDFADDLRKAVRAMKEAMGDIETPEREQPVSRVRLIPACARWPGGRDRRPASGRSPRRPYPRATTPSSRSC